MAKWCGKIGYGFTEENPETLLYETRIVERQYYGDVFRNSRRFNNNTTINGELNISNQLSIVSDPFANANFHSIRYAEFMGTLWTVMDIEVQFPRLLLTLGGVYNGEQA